MSDFASMRLLAPRSQRAPLAARIDGAAIRPLARDSEALRLLTGYVELLRNGPALASAELRRLAAVHVRDLVALVIGATPDAASVAENRGARAARLRAIKADIVANLGRDDLRIEAVSRRHRLTVRYVQRMFEQDRTTFSEFVMSQRLARAHRTLTVAAPGGPSIGDIAAACGFNDHTYFSRCFRRAYGAPPSDIRAAARKKAGR
jgi:transcriptional regulator GlxA family with amidase domain